MQKRGYFFTLDVLIAMIVMVVGFLLIWSSMAAKPHVVQPYFLAQDIIDFLSESTVADISSMDYVKNLIDDGNITDTETTTVLEQIALFHYRNQTIPGSRHDVLLNFTRAVLENATPMQYSFEFLLHDDPLSYSLYYQQNPANKLQADSDSLVSAKTIISVVVDKSDISPPYVAEVRVWQ